MRMTLSRALNGVVRPSAASFRWVVQTGGADDLARRAAEGDRTAFTGLMTAHKENLYRFVRRRVWSADEACDIVQEAFISAWKAIGRYDPNQSFGAWLRSIALNKCRDRARRAAVRSRVSAPATDELVAQARDPNPSPEDQLIARRELAALARAVDALPPHLKDALMLTTMDGLSHAMAAVVLGCTVKAVEYRVHRAREIVAREIGLSDG